MKVFPVLYFLILLLAIGCGNPDEIVPTRPADGESPTPLSPAADTTNTPESVSGENPANDTADLDFDTISFEYSRIGELPVRILYPEGYDENKKYPLVLFLHGIGESGTDNERQLTWGASHFLQDSIREKYPAIVVFPQCATDHFWFDRWGLHQLSGLVDTLRATLPLDETRLYIGGLSMGAYGTYALTAYRPGVFAAAIAISGDGDEKEKGKMARTKNWWIFAGKKDAIVRASKSEKMAKALKSANAKVKFTLYDNADHDDSWIFAFEEPDFCSWLFAQRK